MANPKALVIIKEGVQPWNENWNSIERDLSKVDLHGQDLTAVRFEATNLAYSNLQGCDLSNAHLERADLTGAALGSGDSGANLCDALLREAKLKDCDLSGVKGGLQHRQLAGADLTGATLPGALTRLFDKLDVVEEISDSARKLFVTMLAACLYSWITIATTTDLNLITNRASSPLPIIQASIPIVGFYVVAPLLLLCVYFYFHFYLQKLWDELGSLPAIFSDGRRLDERSDPWLLGDLVRAHASWLKVDRPFMSYFQQALSMALAWWLVPITLLLFWARYLPRHDLRWTTLHVALLAISITAAVLLYRLTAATLRGVERRPFSWTRTRESILPYGAVAVFLASGAFFMLLSVGAIRGFPPGRQDWCTGEKTGRWSWVPRAMALVHYSPFADLTNADVSIKPPNWTGSDEGELKLVKGAELSVSSRRRVLQRADLRYADASGAFLAKANLSGSHLEAADLMLADLRQADGSLESVYMRGADLTAANLREARLPNADLRDTWWPGADLTNAELSRADLTHSCLGATHLRGAILRDAHLYDVDLTNADLSGALLEGADLTFADFRSLDSAHMTTGLTALALRTAKAWDKAYYDIDLLDKLGLPRDHNSRLEEERRKEQQELPSGWRADCQNEARVESTSKPNSKE